MNQPNDEKKRYVVNEIRARAKQGRPINSGANRSDGLYTAAVSCFGSWGEAVEYAGFDYRSVRQRQIMPAQEVLARIRELVAVGQPLLCSVNRRVAHSAKRHFGSWALAVRAAGYAPQRRRKWTYERFEEVLLAEMAAGRSLAAAAITNRMGQGVYKAGRRLHGSWAEATDAVRRQVAVEAFRQPDRIQKPLD